MGNYCTSCGTPVTGRFCANCGVRTESAMTYDEAKKLLSRTKRGVCPTCAYGGMGHIRDGCWSIALEQVLMRHAKVVAGHDTVMLHGERIDTREMHEIAEEVAREAEALTNACALIVGFAYEGR